MQTLDTWLKARGPTLNQLINNEQETIYTIVSAQLSATFPSLCYDPTRFDAHSFQDLAYHKTPHRFHGVMQTVFRFRTLRALERSYQWSWGVLPRYGVTKAHFITQARFSFDAIRDAVYLNQEDRNGLKALEQEILHMMDQIMSNQTNGKSHRPLLPSHFRQQN